MTGLPNYPSWFIISVLLLAGVGRVFSAAWRMHRGAQGSGNASLAQTLFVCSLQSNFSKNKPEYSGTFRTSNYSITRVRIFMNTIWITQLVQKLLLFTIWVTQLVQQLHPNSAITLVNWGNWVSRYPGLPPVRPPCTPLCPCASPPSQFCPEFCPISPCLKRPFLIPDVVSTAHGY